jgi:hypothetical protein
MNDMSSFQLVALLLGAAVFGVLVTIFVQWAVSIRTLTREVTRASRSVNEVAERLKPAAERVERITGIVSESEPDLRRTQLALRQFSELSLQLTESMARVSGWIAFAAPLAASAFERWSASHPAAEPQVRKPTDAHQQRSESNERSV